jgi:hypothetical protein
MVPKEQDLHRRCYRGVHDEEATMKISPDMEDTIENGGFYFKEMVMTADSPGEMC